MTQLEFPFTRNGALLRYVTDEVAHINKLFRNHISVTKNYHYIRSKDQFIMNYVSNGGAKEYAKQHSDAYFKDVVEKENDLVLRKWKDNNLFPNWKGLESKLNGDIPHNR